MDIWCNGQNIETAVSIAVTDTDLLCNEGYITGFKKLCADSNAKGNPNQIRNHSTINKNKWVKNASNTLWFHSCLHISTHTLTCPPAGGVCG